MRDVPTAIRHLMSIITIMITIPIVILVIIVVLITVNLLTKDSAASLRPCQQAPLSGNDQ